MTVPVMDESIHVTQLQLDRAPHVVVANHLGKVRNDPLPALEASPVIIRQFQNKKFFENVAVDAH